MKNKLNQPVKSIIDSEGVVVFKQVKSWLNFNYKKSSKKMGIDMTVPDQTMSLRDIVEKHSRGIVIDGQKTSIFDELEVSQGINPMTLDLIDLQEMGIFNQQKINDLRKQVVEEKEKRVAAANEARQKMQDEAAERALKRMKDAEKKTNTP